MRQIRGKTAAFVLAMLASPPLFAHPGEHGVSGLMAELMHLLAEHGYLPVLLLGGLGWYLLRRSRST